MATQSQPVIPVPIPPGGLTVPVPIPNFPDPRDLVPGAGAYSAAQQAVAYLDAAKRWVADRHNWVRVGWTLAGGLLIYGGVIVMARRPIASAATKAAAVASKVPL